MASLNDLMKGRTRGDGTKYRLKFQNTDEWFEPIYLLNTMWHGVNNKNRPVSYGAYTYVSWEVYTGHCKEMTREESLAGRIDELDALIKEILGYCKIKKADSLPKIKKLITHMYDREEDLNGKFKELDG